VSVLGKKVDCYEVDIQCDLEKDLVKHNSDNEDEDQEHDVNKGTGHTRVVIYKNKNKSKAFAFKGGKSSTAKKTTQPVMFDIVEEGVKENKEESNKPFKLVNDDYKRQILNSSELNSFVDRSSRYIERVNFLHL
jgi:hypothetical protein